MVIYSADVCSLLLGIHCRHGSLDKTSTELLARWHQGLTHWWLNCVKPWHPQIRIQWCLGEHDYPSLMDIVKILRIAYFDSDSIGRPTSLQNGQPIVIWLRACDVASMVPQNGVVHKTHTGSWCWMFTEPTTKQTYSFSAILTHWIKQVVHDHWRSPKCRTGPLPKPKTT